jgi:hypothetical protein
MGQSHKLKRSLKMSEDNDDSDILEAQTERPDGESENPGPMPKQVKDAIRAIVREEVAKAMAGLQTSPMPSAAIEPRLRGFIDQFVEMKDAAVKSMPVTWHDLACVENEARAFVEDHCKGFGDFEAVFSCRQQYNAQELVPRFELAARCDDRAGKLREVLKAFQA